MSTEMTDQELADDDEVQLRMIVEVYASHEDPYDVDAVLSHVSWVRRMKRKGILDLIAEYPDEEEPD